jgi:signal transduction histidine kinase
MRRLLPQSLGGQMALLLGLALLVAQLVNFALILNERQKLSLAQNQGPALARFASVAADVAHADPHFRGAILADASHRGARFWIARSNHIAEENRSPAIEDRLTSALGELGVVPTQVRASIVTRAAGDGPQRPGGQALRLAVAQGNGEWLVGRIVTPRRDPWLALRLAAATLLLYAIVLGATIWLALRLSRPLRDLTKAAESFGGRTLPVPVPTRGPSDLRRAIAAFNAMNLRVLALVDEKDRMLGAIGHDLRTPLTSLRIRIEMMEPEDERDAAIAKIAEMIAMLEDILVLARTGRAREEARPIDVAALCEVVVEDDRALGREVSFESSARRIMAVQANLLKRAVRNLVDNAVTYGGSAVVRVVDTGQTTEIRVIDRGPGVPEDRRESVTQPFVRLEESRNRATGGSGLGLAIAQSIAETHGGRLDLRQTEPHGLTAVIVLPNDRAPATAATLPRPA